MNGAASREVEGVVIVRPPGAKILSDIEGLTTLAGFDLVRLADRDIADTYFDTPDGRLGRGRIALRLRVQDGRQLLTLKAGGSQPSGGPGVSDRLELEAPWSAHAFAVATSKLRELGMTMDSAPGGGGPDGEGPDPVAFMKAAGLDVVQRRHTFRRPREVTAPGGGAVVAELAVDRVAYLFGDRTVRVAEVEVEAKGTGDAATVGAVLAALERSFPGGVEAWPYGKVATGEAIATLLASGELVGLVDPDGTLHPEGHELLSKELARPSGGR